MKRKYFRDFPVVMAVRVAPSIISPQKVTYSTHTHTHIPTRVNESSVFFFSIVTGVRPAVDEKNWFGQCRGVLNRRGVTFRVSSVVYIYIYVMLGSRSEPQLLLYTVQSSLDVRVTILKGVLYCTILFYKSYDITRRVSHDNNNNTTVLLPSPT
jgi:hypothetical protein